MAVYTDVSLTEAAHLMATLGLGEVQGLHGIESGIENTNYFVETPAGRFVLTVFERLGFTELPYYLRLMQHLARRGVPVPEPRTDAHGEVLHSIRGKPAAVVDRLPGHSRLAPDAGHCASVGRVLARMHLAADDFGMRQPNLRGLPWWTETVPVVRRFLSPEQQALIDSELAFAQQLAASAAFAALPRGQVHADLFRDNVLFEADAGGDDELTGCFDFYFAGTDTFVFDLAVCLNDWAIDVDSGRLDEDRADAFVRSYEQQRPLTSGEQRLLPAVMRGAALRFWISRLRDLHLPRDASLLTAHDPAHFERVLKQRIAAPWHPARSPA